MATQYEENEQIELARHLDAAGLIWCHPPNGGKRHKAVAAKLKAQGVKPGVPDVLIFGPPHRLPDGCAGVAIELKRAPLPSGRKMGRASKAQLQWLANLEACGWLTTVQHGFSAADRWLRAQGVIR